MKPWSATGKRTQKLLQNSVGIARSALDGSFRPSHIGRRKRVPGRHKTWNESELDQLKKESPGLPLGLTQFALRKGGGRYCVPGLPQVSPTIPEKTKGGKEISPDLAVLPGNDTRVPFYREAVPCDIAGISAEMIKKRKEIYCPLTRSIQNTARSTLLSPLRRKTERPVPRSPAA